MEAASLERTAMGNGPLPGKCWASSAVGSRFPSVRAERTEGDSMIITNASLRAMFKGFQVLFKAGMGMAEPWGDQIARKVPSTGEEETYSWLTAIPGLRHWVGPRVVENLRT